MGSLECDAGVAYYRREWFRLLRAAILLTRYTFALPWPSDTLGGVACAARDPAAAPYRLVTCYHGESFDPACAAQLEVEWWRVHRHTSATARVQTNGRLSKRWRPLIPMSTTDRTETAAFTMSDRLRALAQRRPGSRPIPRPRGETQGVAFGSRSACGSAASARRSRDGRGSAVSRPSTGARSATGPAAAHRGEAVIASWSPRALEDSRHRQRDARLGGRQAAPAVASRIERDSFTPEAAVCLRLLLGRRRGSRDRAPESAASIRSLAEIC